VTQLFSYLADLTKDEKDRDLRFSPASELPTSRNDDGVRSRLSVVNKLDDIMKTLQSFYCIR
jgi:hypothetical protein